MKEGEGMVLMSQYILIPTEKSFCPACNKAVTMLAEQDMQGPAFYICWNCKKVSQVGVGPVEEAI